MAKLKKILEQVLSGRSDANIRFDDARKLLLALGFEERVKSSHHIFRHPGVRQRVNLQEQKGMAKPYQIRQIRTVITTWGLGGYLDE